MLSIEGEGESSSTSQKKLHAMPKNIEQFLCTTALNKQMCFQHRPKACIIKYSETVTYCGEGRQV